MFIFWTIFQQEELQLTCSCFCRFLMTVLCLTLLEKKCTNATLMPSVLISNQVETSPTLAGVQKLIYSFRYNPSSPPPLKTLFQLLLWYKKLLHSQEEQFWYLCCFNIMLIECFVPFLMTYYSNLLCEGQMIFFYGQHSRTYLMRRQVLHINLWSELVVEVYLEDFFLWTLMPP